MNKKCLYPCTPRSTIKGRLRQMWVRSRERAAALKRDNYTCCGCGKKQSKSRKTPFKVDVHHIHGINWEKIVFFIYQELLVHPSDLIVLCPKCHDINHKKETGK